MDGEWKPNEESLQQLLEMGISKEDAEEALRNTGNSSVVFAADYAFAKQDKIDPFLSRVYQIPEGCKMVFVVNTDLGMSIGKLRHRCRSPRVVWHCLAEGEGTPSVGRTLEFELDFSMLFVMHQHSYITHSHVTRYNWESSSGRGLQWKNGRHKGLNYQHLKLLEKEAEVNKLPAHCITDAGLTEVQSGSTTVLAILAKKLKLIMLPEN